MKALTVKSKNLIKTEVNRLWNILITPLYIRQWDELPDGFDDRERLALGTEMKWQHNEDRYTKLTVTEFEVNKLLKMNIYNSWWPENESFYNIGYIYRLSENDEGVDLTVTIGDFSVLEDGENYYNASVEFSEVASAKIKILAEQEPDYL